MMKVGSRKIPNFYMISGTITDITDTADVFHLAKSVTSYQ